MNKGILSFFFGFGNTFLTNFYFYLSKFEFLYIIVYMKGENTRIVNYRGFGLCAVIFISTIFFVVKSFDNIFYTIPLCLLFVAVVLYFGIKKSFGKLIFSIVSFVVILVSLLISIFTYQDTSLSQEKVYITCRVDCIYATYDNSVSVIASSVNVDNTSKYGRILVTIYGESDIEVGDKLSFDSKVKSYDAISLSMSKSKLYKNNVRYYAYTSSEDMSITSGNLTISEKLKLKTKNNLIESMGDKIGGLAYALLYGDKALIETGIYDNFRQTGTAHLLAISGLHISLIIGIVYFFVNKAKIKNYFKFLIMFIFLFVYCYLCQFSISVVRASIMGLTLIGCKLFGKRYDSLNSLAFSLCIILLISPLSLFDVGLLLSYTAVLAIILFSRTLDKVKFPNKIVRKIVLSMFMTTVITIMAYPITASYFGTLPLYSVITNVIIIPIFSIAFASLFVTNIFALIGLKFLLVIPQILFTFIIRIIDFVSELPFAVLEVGGISLGICLLFYILAFVLSKFVMLKSKIKVVSCFVICIFCASIFIGNLAITTNKCGVYTGTEYSFLIESVGKHYIVSPKLSKSYVYNIKTDLDSKGIYALDAIIFSESDTVEVKLLQNFLEYYNCTVYVPTSSSMIDNLESSGVKYIIYETVSLAGNVYLSTDAVGNKTFTKVNVNGTTFVYAFSRLTSQNFDDLGYSIDYVYTNKDFDSINIKNIINDERYINCR